MQQIRSDEEAAGADTKWRKLEASRYYYCFVLITVIGVVVIVFRDL